MLSTRSCCAHSLLVVLLPVGEGPARCRRSRAEAGAVARVRDVEHSVVLRTLPTGRVTACGRRAGKMPALHLPAVQEGDGDDGFGVEDVAGFDHLGEVVEGVAFDG